MSRSYIGSICFIFDKSDLKNSLGHTGDLVFIVDPTTLKIQSEYVKLSKKWREVSVGSGMGGDFDPTELEQAIAENVMSITNIHDELLEFKEEINGHIVEIKELVRSDIIGKIQRNIEAIEELNNKVDELDLVGKTTSDNGEIFNDYTNNKALSEYSTAMGKDTSAKGIGALAAGVGTIANGEGSTSIGAYNIEDTNEQFVLVVGNGTDDENRSNAFSVGRDGSAYVKTDIYIGDKSLTAILSELSGTGAPVVSVYVKTVVKDNNGNYIFTNADGSTFTMSVDNQVTDGSDNIVTSDAVYNAIDDVERLIPDEYVKDITYDEETGNYIVTKSDDSTLNIVINGVTEEERQYWNSKSRVYLDEVHKETLIITT